MQVNLIQVSITPFLQRERRRGKRNLTTLPIAGQVVRSCTEQQSSVYMDKHMIQVL